MGGVVLSNDGPAMIYRDDSLPPEPAEVVSYHVEGNLASAVNDEIHQIEAERVRLGKERQRVVLEKVYKTPGKER